MKNKLKLGERDGEGKFRPYKLNWMVEDGKRCFKSRISPSAFIVTTGEACEMIKKNVGRYLLTNKGDVISANNRLFLRYLHFFKCYLPD